MNFVQKLGSYVSLSRRCLIIPKNSRFFSSELQSENEKHLEVPSAESTEPEKDKLYTRLEIELKGIEPEVMKSYAWFCQRAAEHLGNGIKVGECYALRKSKKDRMTLLKSVHIYAKHLASYEVRTYYHFLNFHNLTQSTLETYLEYIQRNLPEGTAMRATKTELQKLPEHLQL